jgi:transcriptional regulator with XRE-family HTH domain
MGLTMTASRKRPDLGRRLKQLREAKGLTQVELAIKAGLSPSNVAQIEQGQRPDPRVSTVAALAQALGVDIGDLFPPELPAEAEEPPTEPKKARKGK